MRLLLMILCLEEPAEHLLDGMDPRIDVLRGQESTLMLLLYHIVDNVVLGHIAIEATPCQGGACYDQD